MAAVTVIQHTARFGVGEEFDFFAQNSTMDDLITAADWIPTAGDAKIWQPGNPVVNCQNLPINQGGAVWTLEITDKEMQGRFVLIAFSKSGAGMPMSDGVILIDNPPPFQFFQLKPAS